MSGSFSIQGDLSVRIDNLRKGFDAAAQKAGDFSKEVSKRLSGNDYFAPMKKQAKDTFRDIRQIFGGIIFAQGFYQTLDVIKRCTSAVLEYSNALNNANVTFSNLFSNVELGKEFVAVLQEYASRSPFDFTDVEKAATQLAAYGIESKNMMFVMEGIGNLAAVTGDYATTFERVSRAIGQINAAGYLKAQEVTQLAEAGLNVKAIYDKLGTSASTLAQDHISSAKAINAIVDVMNAKYGGALEAANTTVQGLLANLKDVALMVSSAIIQPLYEQIRGFLDQVSAKFSTFQDLFRSGNLEEAIKGTFGEEAVNAIYRWVNSLINLANVIKTAATPAIRLLGMAMQSFSTVVQLAWRVIGPLVTFLSQMLNAFLNTKEGAQIAQTAVMALAASFVIAKVSAAGMMILQVVGKVAEVFSTVMSACSMFVQVFSYQLQIGAASSIAFGKAWRAACTMLNAHPVMLLITAVLTLITAFMGLKAIMNGMASTQLDWSDLNTKDFLKDVKAGTGDINNFNKRISDTNDGLEELGDNLEDAGKKGKKAAEGLLAFDEVFSIPEQKDSTLSDGVLGDLGDLGDTEITWPEFTMPDWPDAENIFGDWWQSILDYLNGLEWPDFLVPLIGSIVNWFDRIWTPFKKAIDKFVKKGGKKLLEAGEKLAGYLTEGLDKAIIRSVEDLSVDEVPTKIAAKISGELESVVGKINGSEIVKALPAAIERSVSDAIDKIALSAPLGKIGAKLLEGATKAVEEVSFEGAVKALPGAVEEAVVKETEKVSFVDFVSKFAEKIGTALKELPGKVAEKLTALDFKSIGAKISARFEATFGKESVLEVIERAFTRATEQEILAVPENLSKALATLSFKDLGVLLVSKLSGTFAAIDLKTIVKSFAEKFKASFSGANLVAALKEGAIIAGMSMVIEYVLECINESLPEAFQGSAFDALLDGFASELALGLATMLVTKGGFKKKLKAAGIMILVDHVFESIAEAFEGGEDSTAGTSAVTNIVGSICAIAPKIISKVPKGVGWAGIASIIGDLVFGGISDWFRSNGDDEAANITNQFGGVVTSGLSGAGIGAMIGSVVPGIGTAIGAAVGAIAGIAIDLISSNWDSVCDFCSRLPGRIQEWWGDVCDTAVKGWDGFVKWISGVPEAIGKFFGGIWDAIVGLFLPEQAYADEISSNGEEVSKGFEGGIEQGFASVIEFLTGIPGTIVGFFAGAVDWLFPGGGDLITGLWNGITGIWTTVTDFFSGIFTAILQLVTGQGDPLQTLFDTGGNLITGLWNGITGIWTTVTNFFTGIGDTIVGFFAGAIDWLFPGGGDVINGLWDGIKGIWEGIIGWFTDLPNNIKNFFEGSTTWLLDKGKNILGGLKDGITNIWTNVSTWFTDLPKNISNFFNGSPTWLLDKGKNILNGLKNGIDNIWNNVSNWFRNIPNNIKNFFGNSPSWLIDKGRNILQGLKNGLSNFWGNITSFFSSIPSRVMNFFGNAGNWLLNAGSRILNGLLNGLRNAWNGVTNFIGGIGNWIISHKGPESYDKKMLIPAGQWIMGGLLNGLQDGWTDVKEEVSQMGPTISDELGDISTDSAAFDTLFNKVLEAIQEQLGSLTSFAYSLGVSVVDSLCDGMLSRMSYLTDTMATPMSLLSNMNALNASSYQTVPTNNVQPVTVKIEQPNVQQESYAEDTSRPIMYVGTLIADTQGIRELKRKMDVIEAEDSRWRYGK